MEKQKVIAAHRKDASFITRERAAYLLRAARSRRANNVERKINGYYIKDGNLSLAFA